MKSLLKLAVAVGVASGLYAGQASANIDFSVGVDDPTVPGSPDLNIPADGSVYSGTVNQLDLGDINPVSIYYDTDGNAGLTSGDLVIDVARAVVSGLDPLIDTTNQVGFGLGWGINVDWFLIGEAIITGDDLFGGFGAGSVTFDVVPLPAAGALGTSDFTNDFVPVGVPVPELTIDVTGSALTGNGIGLDLFGEVSSADEGFMRVESGQFSGQDFGALADNTEVELFANGITTLENADQQPEALEDGETLADYFGDIYDAATAAYLAGLVEAFEAANSLPTDSRLLRTTRLASPVIRFDVPAPATLGLLGLGLLGLGRQLRKQRS